MIFGIYDEYRIKDIIPKTHNTLLIRILEPSNIKEDNSDLRYANDYKKIIHLYLYDIYNVEDIIKKEFNQKNLKIINNIILENNYEEILIHCSLGISRSPAVMICISKIINNKKLEKFIKNNYSFYNQMIIEDFEQINTSNKICDDSDFIFRNDCLKKDKNKILTKKIYIDY